MKHTAKTRSRRLRKKLHVGEFQQFGFDVEFRLSSGLSDRFWDDPVRGKPRPSGRGRIAQGAKQPYTRTCTNRQYFPCFDFKPSNSK
ncbi:50S ribosome-binding protein YggL [Azotobacter vinelandii]|nr:50S ribosome-binding protein YggL [Azotobacter vinelandii]